MDVGLQAVLDKLASLQRQGVISELEAADHKRNLVHEALCVVRDRAVEPYEQRQQYDLDTASVSVMLRKALQELAAMKQAAAVLTLEACRPEVPEGHKRFRIVIAASRMVNTQ